MASLRVAVVFVQLAAAWALVPDLCELLREEPDDAQFYSLTAKLSEVSEQFRRLLAKDKSRFAALQTTEPDQWESVTGIPAACFVVFYLAQVLGIGRISREKGFYHEVLKLSYSQQQQHFRKESCISLRSTCNPICSAF